VRLREVARLDPRAERHRAGVVDVLAREQVQEPGLARPVPAEHRDPLAEPHLQVERPGEPGQRDGLAGQRSLAGPTARLGPSVLARTEFLQSTLERTGLAGPRLVAATHGLANLTIGSALTESAWHTASHVPQEAARAHLTARAAEYPTLAANDHLASPDLDVLFGQAVDCFVAGLTRTVT
jgi:hypothetical protein